MFINLIIILKKSKMVSVTKSLLFFSLFLCIVFSRPNGSSLLERLTNSIKRAASYNEKEFAIHARWLLSESEELVENALNEFRHEYHIVIEPGVRAAKFKTECEAHRLKSKSNKECPSFKELYEIKFKAKE
jgi:hypothetical protein